VELIEIYQCLCDRTRLRILHLLIPGPLCVCHLQGLLDEPQVKISKHLAYLKEKGLVEVHRHQNWMIYQLPTRRSVELEKNLQCLQDCVQTDPLFKKDLKRLRAMRSELKWVQNAAECCDSESPARPRAKR
jgi:ArsR family transcriptional regulator